MPSGTPFGRLKMEYTNDSGHQNMPIYSNYKWKPISKLLQQREIGFCKNRFQTCYVSKYNHHFDLEMIRSMLCDENAYLETIASRKIPRSKAPAYCSGRLFTENYMTWFNLSTGPTSGPLLMTSDLFKLNDRSANFTCIHQPLQMKVVDVAFVIPPNNCKPFGHKRICPHLLLLTKSGWLYEADTESCEIVSKTFIPTQEYASNLCNVSPFKDVSDKVLSRNYSPYHSYRYILHSSGPSICVKSTRNQHPVSSASSYAFCIFLLYPLRLQCHFVVTIHSPNHNPPFVPDVTEDLFLLNVNRASNVMIYCLDDVITEHDFGCNLVLKQKVNVKTPTGLNSSKECVVGDVDLGIPYTMENVVLNGKSVQLKSPCLFKTAAIQHNLQIAVPFHYIVPANKAGTAWTIKHLSDDSDVLCGNLKVEKKWDSSHWNSVRFANDMTDNRVLKQDASSIEIYSISHHKQLQTDVESVASGSRRFDFNCRLALDFVIDFRPVLRCDLTSSTAMPPMPPHTVTSYGRVVRRPHQWSPASVSDQFDTMDEESVIAALEFDVGLNLLVVAHYRPVGYFTSRWKSEEGRAELVVSLFDSFFGKYLRSFVLDSCMSPCDRDTIGITLDEDTFIYWRSRPNDDRIQYKILRLNRKYGSSASELMNV